jgi:myo-inositol-1(or 4)-monophosphatase
MVSTEFCIAVTAAMVAAQSAGRKIADRTWATEISQKPHATFGTSSVSDTDREAERFIVKLLLNNGISAICVGEESEHSFDLEMIMNAPLVLWIDPRDGTTEDAHELPFWCVSVGVMAFGELIGGAVFAPDIRGGLTIVAEQGSGVHIAENNGLLLPAEDVVHVPITAKPVVHLGLDVQRLNAYNGFIRALPKELKPRGVSPSGALGLALVAAGRIDAIVQSPQMPWDFAAGMAMVMERGLCVAPFRIENETVTPVRLYDPKNWRTDRQSLGFVAGKERFVEPLFDLLTKNYGE